MHMKSFTVLGEHKLRNICETSSFFANKSLCVFCHLGTRTRTPTLKHTHPHARARACMHASMHACTQPHTRKGGSNASTSQMKCHQSQHLTIWSPIQGPESQQPIVTATEASCLGPSRRSTMLLLPSADPLLLLSSSPSSPTPRSSSFLQSIILQPSFHYLSLSCI